MEPLQLILSALAVWRLTHLLANEDGPFGVVFWFRKQLGQGFWGQLFDCFYCLSIWIALPFALFFYTKWSDALLHWLALSGAACLLEKATDRTPPAAYREE